MRSSAYTVNSSVVFGIGMLCSGSCVRRGLLGCRPRIHGFYRQPVTGLFADVVDDSLEVSPGRLIGPELPVGAGPVGQDPVYRPDLAAGTQLVDDVVHEFQHLAHELPKRHLDLFAEVDHLAVDPVTAGAPLVLEDERSPVPPEPQVLLAELEKLDANRLKKR